MNRVAGIVFILLYLLVMIRPVLPIVEYWARYDYIVTELCINKDKPKSGCNGKCHLSKQFKQLEEPEQNNIPAPPPIEEKSITLAWLPSISIGIDGLDLTACRYSLAATEPASNFLARLFRPPEFLS